MENFDYKVLLALHKMLITLLNYAGTGNILELSGVREGAIADMGEDLFGKKWYKYQKTGDYNIGYPVINMALGRLQKWGLVQGNKEDPDETYLRWKLTPLGLHAVQFRGPYPPKPASSK